jgi:hypothetical protein
MTAEDQLQYKPSIEEIAAQKRREWITDEILAIKNKIDESKSSEQLKALAFRTIMQACFQVSV